MSPDIFGKKISFVWNNDLWLMDEEECLAVRLTTGLGIVTNSKFSPDGKFIAFRVEYGTDGSLADIYTINLDDGKIRRITYLGGKSTSRRMYTDVAGWTPDGEVVVSTDSYSPFTATTHLYRVKPTGGPLTKMPYGPATHILYFKDGIALGRHTLDIPHWKKYKGGTAGVIWYSKHGGAFRKIVDLKHHVSSPFYVGNRLYFITDLNGSGNIHSVDLTGKGLMKHTNFDKYYVRNAKSDGDRAVFQMGGEIYLYDPQTDNSKLIRVRILSSSDNVPLKYEDASKHLEHFSLDETGKNITIVTRGRGYSTPFDSGFVSEVGNSKERVKFTKIITPNTLIYASDKEGGEDIYIRDLILSNTTQLKFSKGIIENLEVSPEANSIAVSNNRGELYLLKLNKKKMTSTIIDRSTEGIISDIAWSRDGKFVAYSYPVKSFFGSGPSKVIKLYSADEGKCYNITEDGSDDFSPTFSNDGRFLYFLSNRNLDPSRDKVVFDLSFQTTIMPMVVPLDPSAVMTLDNLPIGQQEKRNKENIGNGDRFPIGGLKEKVRSLRIRPSDYDKIHACEDGILLLEFPIEGMSKFGLFSDTHKTGKLIKYNPATQKEDVVIENVSDFVVSGDGRIAVVRDNESNLMRIKVERIEKGASSINSKEKFDYKRLRLEVNLKDEWSQMYSETKRLVRENYWNERKLDEKYKDAFSKYDNFIDLVSSRYELSDILREFQGEFGTSHSYEIGGELSETKPIFSGKLGLDLEFSAGSYYIKHILEANLSNYGEKSPAFLASETLRIGDKLLSVNSRPLNERYTIEEALINFTDNIVRLEVERKGKIITSYIHTIPDEKRLRYREWVEQNRELVHKRTNERVGYIHIPDMGAVGFSEFARLFPVESGRDALIVDVRYNGGGFVSQLLLEKLSKKRIGYDIPRRGSKQPYPVYSLNGPMVELVDENAGSDGDIFTHSFRLLNLGPVIGVRTWGGVIGISPRHPLTDGTIVTQPEFAFWFKDVGFNLENYGAEPTIEVENTPDDWQEGRDSQLEKGIKVAIDLLKEYDSKVSFPEQP